MNQNVIEFVLIFCALSAIACVVLLVMAASAQPVDTGGAIAFGAGAAVFVAGALALNKKRKANL